VDRGLSTQVHLTKLSATLSSELASCSVADSSVRSRIEFVIRLKLMAEKLPCHTRYTGGVIDIVKQNSLLLWITRAILSAVLLAPTALQAEAADEDDNLTPVEENYAYSTQTPSQRVKAFLKVAEGKLQQVKKNSQKGSSSDISVPFKGYSTAMEGAWMGVSWGQALRADMRDSVRAIQKTTQRHVETLRKLEATAGPSQREALAQILSRILQIQSAEASNLYARN
jgi:hypothetical protein